MKVSTRRGHWPAIAVPALGSAFVIGLVYAWWLLAYRVTESLQSGREAYAQGNWETALSLARKRLKEAGHDREALRLLARSSVQLGRDSSAISLYDRLGPQAMAADDLYLLGLALARTGSRAGSVDVWRQALKADPDHAAALYQMTWLNLQADQFQAAVAAASRLARNPAWKDRADAILGWVEYRRNEPEKAAELWQRVLTDRLPAMKNAPDLLVTKKDLARALLCAGQPARARSQLQRILAGGPDPEASWLLSRALLQEGALPEAARAFQAAGSFSEENPVLHEPASFIGAAACAPCHAEKYQAQQSSRHARTFHRMAELLDLGLPQPEFPDPANPKVVHKLRRAGDHLEQETQTAEHTYKAVVDYVFGSGDRGRTLVGHDNNGNDFELRLSVYQEHGTHSTWDVTSGHALQPASDEGFLGRPRTTDEVRRCFSCHVTSPEAILGSPAVVNIDHAIGCERCHGPGGNHRLAIAARFPDPAIARPSLVSGDRIVQICAQCHSPRDKKIEPDDPGSIRFQGTTLTWSRCYTESGNALDCVTCHDPHRDAITDEHYYEAKCLICHSGREKSEKDVSGKEMRHVNSSGNQHLPGCPINPAADCISCHMPKVEGVVPHSAFTDHFIRVHRESTTVSHQ